MSDTAKRVELLKLLQALRQGDEKPGGTILRALRFMADDVEEKQRQERIERRMNDAVR